MIRTIQIVQGTAATDIQFRQRAISTGDILKFLKTTHIQGLQRTIRTVQSLQFRIFSQVQGLQRTTIIFQCLQIPEITDTCQVCRIRPGAAQRCYQIQFSLLKPAALIQIKLFQRISEVFIREVGGIQLYDIPVFHLEAGNLSVGDFVVLGCPVLSFL